MPHYLSAELLQRGTFGGLPGTLAELHHADAMAAPEHAQCQAECRRRFALAGASVNDQQTLLGGLAGDLGILHRLALRHLGAVAFGLGLIDWLAHGAYKLPFTT